MIAVGDGAFRKWLGSDEVMRAGPWPDGISVIRRRGTGEFAVSLSTQRRGLWGCGGDRLHALSDLGLGLPASITVMNQSMPVVQAIQATVSCYDSPEELR